MSNPEILQAFQSLYFWLGLTVGIAFKDSASKLVRARLFGDRQEESDRQEDSDRQQESDRQEDSEQ